MHDPAEITHTYDDESMAGTVVEISRPAYRALCRDIGGVEEALAYRWESVRLDLITERVRSVAPETTKRTDGGNTPTTLPPGWAALLSL